MIQKMKKATVVCCAVDQEKSLLALRKLASVHAIHQQEPDSRRRQEVLEKKDELEKLLLFLETLWKDARKSAPKESAAAAVVADSASVDEGACRRCRKACLEEFGELRRLEAERERLCKGIRELRPWGHFRQELLDRLARCGWNGALIVRPDRKETAGWLAAWAGKREGAQEFVCHREEGKAYALVLAPFALGDLPYAPLQFSQGTDLAALENRLAVLEQRLSSVREALAARALRDLPLLKKEQSRLERELEFFTVRDGMGRAGKALCYLQGYVPECRLDALRLAAHENGWAIRYEEVAPDDPQVPTSLQMPKHLEMAKVVLDFIGILPGYNEVDISVAVMIFLSIFCGMLVGDAGYGVLFAGLSLWGILHFHKKGKEDPAAKAFLPPLKLFLFMSLCIFAWGALTGNWLGFSWGGLHWFTDPQNNRGQLNVQLFCFFLAAIHLSLGHLWKIPLSHTWRGRLGNLGWAIFLWANFFTVKCLLIDNAFHDFAVPGAMYAVGTVLILLFSIQWNNVGDVIYSPFTFINSISDLLSYIRLYAVGLSSLYIAQAFNDMCAMLWRGNHWLLPVGLLIVLAGHALNICMALMSVLVHGIRLNTLEFSGHIGVEWGGRPYHPFQ